MSRQYPSMPVPSTSRCDGIDIEALPSLGLPRGSLTLSILAPEDGEAFVATATLRLLWSKPAPAWPEVAGQTPKCDVRVLDTGRIAVEFDSLGRIDNIEATSYVPGTRWLPETVALSHEEASKRPDGQHIVLSIVATIMRYWPVFEAKWRARSEPAKTRQSREWGVLESSERYADCW